MVSFDRRLSVRAFDPQSPLRLVTRVCPPPGPPGPAPDPTTVPTALPLNFSCGKFYLVPRSHCAANTHHLQESGAESVGRGA